NTPVWGNQFRVHNLDVLYSPLQCENPTLGELLEDFQLDSDPSKPGFSSQGGFQPGTLLFEHRITGTGGLGAYSPCGEPADPDYQLGLFGASDYIVFNTTVVSVGLWVTNYSADPIEIRFLSPIDGRHYRTLSILVPGNTDCHYVAVTQSADIDP